MRRLAVLMWGLPADSAVSRVVAEAMPAPEMAAIPKGDGIPRIGLSELAAKISGR